MSANIGQIVAEITANTAGLRRGAAEAKSIMQDTSNGASAAGKAIGVAFAVTAALGVMKLIDKLEDCTQVAIDNKKALMGLESVAKAYGVSADEAKKATQAFTQDGLLQMKSATIGMKNIISTGFNISEAMKLSEALKDIGAFNNVTGDIGQAFEDATKGMRTGSIELIENIGLTQKLSAVMKAAGVDISNGIDLTNNAAQREAFYNMVLKEGEKFKGNAAKLADDQASSQAKANAAMKEAADAIGNRLLPSYSALMTTITTLSKITADIFKETEYDKVTRQIIEQKTELGMLSATYLKLKDKVDKTTGEQEAYNTAISELQRIYPGYLKNLDLNNIKTETAKNLLSQLNDEMDVKFIKMQAEAANADLYKKSVEELKKEVSATLILNKLLAEKAEWEKSDRYKQGYGKDFATPIKFYQKIKDEAVRNQKEIQESIKGTEDYYNKVLETAKNRRKKYFFEPKNIFNTYNPDAETYTQPKETKETKETKEKKEKTAKKESYSLDTTESTKQKLIEQEYKYKVDLANAKEEEKWRVELENKKAVAVIKAVAETEKKIAAIRKDVESGKKLESVGKKQAQELNEALAEQLGKLELDLTVKEKGVDYAKNALGLSSLESYGIIVPIEGDITQLENDLKRLEEDFENSDLGKWFAQVNAGNTYNKEPEYVKKTLDDVTKSFADLASVLDNDVLNALSNVASQAMSMKGSISGFSAAQGAGDKLGMWSSGLGVFSSAVSIFQSVGGIFSVVGGLFSKSTYNFDEAVKKMLAGIGEKTPELQVAEYEKGIKLKTDIEALNLTGDKAGYDKLSAYLSSINMSFVEYYETLAAIEKIIPQLADQLGTAAGDFGSAIGSALSSATTSEELKANLYDSIYGTVKSGLINAFLAGEVMKPLLENLQKTVTIAVADGTLDEAEKTTIQGLLGNVNTEAGKFYDALEKVGLNVVDAAGQLNEAADRMDNVNRNLRLADRISTITTQTSVAGITQLAGSGNIVYDFSNANLGGMTEQQVISAVSKANRMASIRKVGV